MLTIVTAISDEIREEIYQTREELHQNWGGAISKIQELHTYPLNLEQYMYNLIQRSVVVYHVAKYKISRYYQCIKK